MRALNLAILVGMLVGGALPGCAVSPAERESTVRAWAGRDAERAPESTPGRVVAGARLFRGAPLGSARGWNARALFGSRAAHRKKRRGTTGSRISSFRSFWQRK